MAKIHKAQGGLFMDTAVNPRTGRVWTLADAELKGRVDALQQSVTRSAGDAEKFLKKSGLLTAGGKLTKKYGG